jgi:hypothetical protein
MWLWVLCVEIVVVVPLVIQGLKKDSIGECFECAVLRSMSIGLLLLAVTCAMNRLWVLSGCLLTLFWFAGMVGSYFKREYKFTEAGSENIHHLILSPNAKFALQDRTSMLIAKSGFGMLWLCAFGYMLCYRHLGLSVLVSIVAGFGTGLFQFVILSVASIGLFSRRVIALFGARG